MVADLKTAMRLAGENLLYCLDRDNGLIPFWELTTARDYTAQMRRFWPAHNLGRWWDAMLRLEQATGFEIPADVEAAMLHNLQWFFFASARPSSAGANPSSNSIRCAKVSWR
jgi:hypothetical protein